MKTFWLLLLAFQNARAGMVTWDFGADSEGLIVVMIKSGDIGSNKKVTQVSFPVSPCMNVKYVRVEMQNLVTTPAVSYNRDTHTVTIAYKLLSLSTRSHYDIMAKGKMKKSCGGGPATRFPNQHQEPGSQYGHPANGGHYDNNGHYIQPHQYPNHGSYENYPNYGSNEKYPNYGSYVNYPNYGGYGNYGGQGKYLDYWGNIPDIGTDWWKYIPPIGPFIINGGGNIPYHNGIIDQFSPNGGVTHNIQPPNEGANTIPKTHSPSTQLPKTENPPHYPSEYPQPNHPPDYGSPPNNPPDHGSPSNNPPDYNVATPYPLSPYSIYRPDYDDSPSRDSNNPPHQPPNIIDDDDTYDSSIYVDDLNIAKPFYHNKKSKIHQPPPGNPFNSKRPHRKVHSS